MIATKTIGISTWAAALWEAAKNGGAIGVILTGAVAAALIAIAEHAPTRHWICTKATKLKERLT